MKNTSSKRETTRGSVMVQTVGTLFFTFIFTLAIIQWGLILNAIHTVQYETREAARYAAVHYEDTNWSTNANTNLTTFLSTRAGSSGSTVPVSGPGVTITYYGPGSTLPATGQNIVTPSTAVTVGMSYDLSYKILLYPIVPGLHRPWTYTYYQTTMAEGM